MARTEDQVRNSAGAILGFVDSDEAISGTGQTTTFNQLGFEGVIYKPDGWYLPKDKGGVAIILETKSENVDLDAPKLVTDLNRRVDVTMSQYSKVIGILYNGRALRCFKNKTEIQAPTELQNKQFYIDLFLNEGIDKQRIYNLTARINNLLHNDFGVTNLYHRMILTACALVAARYGAKLETMKGQPFQTLNTTITTSLSKSLEKDRKQNDKIDILLQEYSMIRMNTEGNDGAISSFIDCVVEISECINLNKWHGEDVMGIFFNEFNRYKKKSEAGQVFTPEHITDFMYRILEVSQNDRVLDAACGSGGFLVKAMSNMIHEAGGMNTGKAAKIKSSQLYGIEFYKEIYALACANMLIHKDGKTNLECLDSRTKEAGSWIKSKSITKVLMNPPFETKFGCMEIVKNVLDNVPQGTMCAFILPDKKLEKTPGITKQIKKKHRLRKVVKLPEDVFKGTGVTTSIFVFEAGTPQGENEFFTCWMKDDGLETVKNKGRHDLRGRWPAIENHWVDIIIKQSGDETCKWEKPSECMSYQTPAKPFEITEEDFRKTAMYYLMYKKGIDAKGFSNSLFEKVMYSSDIKADDGTVTVTMRKGGSDDDED